MNYARIARRVYGEPWCITAEMHEQIMRVLQARLDHGAVPIDEGKLLQLYSIRNQFNAAKLALTPPKNAGSRVYTSGKLALVPVQGIIGKNISLMEQMCGGYSIDQLQSDINDVGEDSSITKALFCFASPGGQISGIPETAKMLAELGKTKETYGFSDSESNSAAYWLMSQCNYIYGTETAEFGSIGVYVALLDRTKQMEAAGVKLTLVKAGKNKGAGLPGNPLTEEQISELQGKVDAIYNSFTSAITARRPQVSKETMQGQTFMGQTARKAGLVDAFVLSLGSLVSILS